MSDNQNFPVPEMPEPPDGIEHMVTMTPSTAIKLMVLDDLSKAMQAIEMPEDKLPAEVKDHNGKPVEGADRKRLALVRKSIFDAGAVMYAITRVECGVETGITELITKIKSDNVTVEKHVADKQKQFGFAAYRPSDN